MKAQELRSLLCCPNSCMNTPECACNQRFDAALSAERGAGWRVGVEAAREIVCKAADECYAGDLLLRSREYARIADRIRALSYPAPEPQAEPAATSGGGQPDEAVVARARDDARAWSIMHKLALEWESPSKQVQIIAAALREVERETVERCALVADSYTKQGLLEQREMAGCIADEIRDLVAERHEAD